MGVRPEIHDLIGRAQAGERSAFEQLVGRFALRLEALVRLRLGAWLRNHVEVDDVVQETFLKAFQAIAQFQGEGNTFWCWLGTIADRVIADEKRRLRAQKRAVAREVSLARPVGTGDEEPRELGAALKAEGDRPTTMLRLHERFDRLEAALRTLPADYQDVIILARIRGLAVKEVARHLGRSPDATSMLLKRALSALKAALGHTDSYRLPRDRSLDEEGGAHGPGA